MASQFLQYLSFIQPEVILTITLCVLIIAFIIFKKNASVPFVVAIFGLAAAMVSLVGKLTINETLFNGMLVVDPFSQFFKVVIILAAIFITAMSRYSEEIKSVKDSQGEYYFFILAMTIGMMLMVGSSNLLMMYLTLEMTGLTSYVAAGYTKKAKDSAEASMKYLLYGAFSSGVMLYGISIVYGLTGTMDIAGVNNILSQGSANNFTLLIATIFIVVGFGYKISAVPFHYWTPDVYEGAPVTITAFLSVASKAAGFAMMMRAFKVMFMDSSALNLAPGMWTMINGVQLQNVLIVLSVLTMTIGNLVALWQDNVKRLLAFSSIAQAGYMLLGLVVLGNDGFSAVMIYFVVYLFMNLGAFYCVLLIANKIGSENIDDYKGIGKRAPLLAVGFAIFLISLTGLPPTAGFVGKWMIFLALINAKMVTLAIVGVINSVVSLYYYIRIIRNMFLRDEVVESGELRYPLAQKMVLLALLIPTLYFGLFFTQLVEFAQMSVTMFGVK
jgi:NADH-quinone oxidoreductase subunit N